jgi:uncharacterized protein with FMN-binding domain
MGGKMASLMTKDRTVASKKYGDAVYSRTGGGAFQKLKIIPLIGQNPRNL